MRNPRQTCRKTGDSAYKKIKRHLPRPRRRLQHRIPVIAACCSFFREWTGDRCDSTLLDTSLLRCFGSERVQLLLGDGHSLGHAEKPLQFRNYVALGATARTPHTPPAPRPELSPGSRSTLI